MTEIPTLSTLQTALAAAGSAHHDYEANFLKGARDEQWSGFYAAFTLGRLGEFAKPTPLTKWLQSAPGGTDWPAGAARHVLEQLGS